MKYIGKNSILFNWKTQNAKNVGAFWNQLILYEIKLIFNELYAVINNM